MHQRLLTLPVSTPNRLDVKLFQLYVLPLHVDHLLQPSPLKFRCGIVLRAGVLVYVHLRFLINCMVQVMVLLVPDYRDLQNVPLNDVWRLLGNCGDLARRLILHFNFSLDIDKVPSVNITGLK